VTDPENPNANPIERQLNLKNESGGAINYRFETTDDFFEILPSSGQIEYSAIEQVFFRFRPKEPLPYSAAIPLYALTDSTKVLISTIQAVGVGSSRKFQTSTDYLCLPIVPLGITTEQRIQIWNLAAIQTTITTKLAINQKVFPLSVTFPAGNRLTYSTSEIPLLVSFVSDRPASFSTIVALIDSEGDSYSFTISVMTDNSVFTL
jgi:hypothetical protein